MRSAAGLDTTAINQRLTLRSPLRQSYDETERSTLIDKNVTPLEKIGTSARVADDLTTVSDDNAEEANYKYGFTRLAVDFLVSTSHDLEEPFVGKFNSSGVMGVFQKLLNKEARPLNQSNVIYDHDVKVTMLSPTRAKVVFQADVAEPIRFIENEFIIGNSSGFNA
jgi:hypothetical protein